MAARDRYKTELGNGPIRQARSLEEAFSLVVAVYPGAYAEGSTGFERSIWLRVDGEPVHVGHLWSRHGGSSWKVRWLKSLP